MSLRGALALAIVLGAGVVAGPARADDTAVDVAIAIDTTGSMQPSIEQARLDARRIVADTRQRLPNARFGLIQFRDHGDTPEYRVEQAMTADGDDLAEAVARLEADGGGDSPEAYTLLFHRAATDPDIGFRAGATKLLFVLGDAEPHGAGTAGLAGCTDRSPDPDGLDLRAALAGLRDGEITLNMVLQASSAQTGLDCYRSLVARAYGNGTARSSGKAPPPGCAPAPTRADAPASGRAAIACPLTSSGDSGSGTAAPAPAAPGALAKAVDESLSAALPAATITRTAAGAVRVVVTNRAGKPVTLRRIDVTLPAGARYRAGSARGLTRSAPTRKGQVLRFTTPATVAPDARRVLALRIRGAGRVRVAARITMPDGGAYTARGRSTAR